MQYLIGTDEAGYGPNLGPLTVSATVWRVPEGVRGDGLIQRLGGVVVATPKQVAAEPGARVAMADSKRLYQPRKGLRHLERGLLAALATLGQEPRTWADLWTALAPVAVEPIREIPWYAGYDEAVPIDADADVIESLAAALKSAMAANEVHLLDIQSRAVFPEEFNELVDRYDSKGAALSHITLDLIGRVMGPLGDSPISILCDKHGGRNRYAPLLSDHFPDSLIEVHGESRQQSVYRFGPTRRRVECRFQAKGESHLPAALASMASKYLRELAMRAFNSFWRERIPELRPTAGYPQDAKRFRAEITPLQKELGIDDRVLWRNR